MNGKKLYEVTYTVNHGVRRSERTVAKSSAKAVSNVRYKAVGPRWADFVKLDVREVS